MQGQGTKFNRLNTAVSPSVYVQMAKLMELEDAEATRGSNETTEWDQAGPYQTFEPEKIIDAGEISLSLKFIPGSAEEIALAADSKAEANQTYQLEYPDGSTLTVVGHITKWGKSTPQVSNILRNITVKISGEPVFVAA